MPFDVVKEGVAIDEARAKALFDGYEQAIEEASKTDIDGVIDLESLCSGTMRLSEGDLTLDELHLRAGGPSLIVKGNLTVKGIIEQELRAGFLIVFGDLRARDIATTSQIFVTGDLSVEGTLYGNCTNFMTSVLGQTRARRLVSAKEHYFCLYGGRAIERIVDVYGDTPNLDDRTDGEEALVEGTDKGFDEKAVAALLREGRSILRS